MMSNSSRQESFTRSWRSIKKNTLWLGNTEGLEDFRVLDRKFDNFFDLLDLLGKTTDHIVGRIWNFLDLHQGDKRINFRRKNFMEQI